MLYELLRQYKKPLIIGAVALAVLAIALGIFNTMQHQGKIAMTVAAVPADADITIDGNPVQPGTVHLEAGSHKIVAKKEGFTTYDSTQYLDDDKKFISISLSPESAEAQEWATNNQAKYLELEGRTGEAAKEEGEAFTAKNPITDLLPHDSLLFTIGYRNDESDPSGNSIVLEIDAEEGYRQNAITQIQEWGYDPTDFKINFRNYVNPF